NRDHVEEQQRPKTRPASFRTDQARRHFSGKCDGGANLCNSRSARGRESEKPVVPCAGQNESIRNTDHDYFMFDVALVHESSCAFAESTKHPSKAHPGSLHLLPDAALARGRRGGSGQRPGETDLLHPETSSGAPAPVVASLRAYTEPAACTRTAPTMFTVPNRRASTSRASLSPCLRKRAVMDGSYRPRRIRAAMLAARRLVPADGGTCVVDRTSPTGRPATAASDVVTSALRLTPSALARRARSRCSDFGTRTMNLPL